MGLERGLVPEAGGAVRVRAVEGALARVLPEVVAQVHARLERLRAHRARKVPDVLFGWGGNAIVAFGFHYRVLRSLVQWGLVMLDFNFPSGLVGSHTAAIQPKQVSTGWFIRSDPRFGSHANSARIPAAQAELSRTCNNQTKNLQNLGSDLMNYPVVNSGNFQYKQSPNRHEQVIIMLCIKEISVIQGGSSPLGLFFVDKIVNISCLPDSALPAAILSELAEHGDKE